MLFSWGRRAGNHLFARLSFKEGSRSASSSRDLHLGKEIVILTGEVATCLRSWELIRGRAGVGASVSYFSLEPDGWT